MEIGLAIVALAVLSAFSMLMLGRYAPRSAPPGLSAALAGHTPAGSSWTLDPDYSQPGLIRWVWRCASRADPMAAWRGAPLVWDAATHRASGALSDPPDGRQQVADWTVAGERVPPKSLALLGAAPSGVLALGWDRSGWVYAELPPSESPDAVVAFGSLLADALAELA